MSFESISIETMNQVVGAGETACRVAGSVVGGALGGFAGTVPGLMAPAGAVNTVTSAAQRDPAFGIDAIATGASLIPGASAVGGAWTGARIGSRMGALACGYRP